MKRILKKGKNNGAATFAALMLMVFFSGCYYDKDAILNPGTGGAAINCTTTPAKFGADVNPIIQSKCAISGCHNASGAGGVILLNYNQISAAASRINVRAVVQKTMPSSGPLPKADLDKIQCWINSGAPNN
jgi:uncharacterized membrane protein